MLKRTFLRGMAGLFAVAMLPQLPALPAPSAAGPVDAFVVLNEQCQVGGGVATYVVRWIVQVNGVVLNCTAAIDNWNDLGQRESARQELRLAVQDFINQHGA